MKRSRQKPVEHWWALEQNAEGEWQWTVDRCDGSEYLGIIYWSAEKPEITPHEAMERALMAQARVFREFADLIDGSRPTIYQLEAHLC